MSKKERLLWEASKVWCPQVSTEFPRQASTEHRVQEPVTGRYEMVSGLLSAADAGRNCYVSTYSFPRGHTDDGANIPEIDTIFVDFDIPPDSEYRQRNQTLDAWKRSMSDLLIRVQEVADAILDAGTDIHWRASLSGHKGVHLFFDFEPIHTANGTYTQFKNGLKQYGDGMIGRLDELSGGINIDPWVDVDSSDLARLVRMPNTPHADAEHIPGETWCVPVTIEELSSMTPEKYLKLTGGPREMPYTERTPSPDARREIGVKIANASGSGGAGPGVLR